MASSSKDVEAEFKCFVGHLDSDVGTDDLEKAFSPFGEVTHTYVFYQDAYYGYGDEDEDEYGKVLGYGKVFGFVTFKEEKSMRDAIKGMNGQEKTLIAKHSTIKVEVAYSSRKNRRGRGGSKKKKNG